MNKPKFFISTVGSTTSGQSNGNPNGLKEYFTEMYRSNYETTKSKKVGLQRKYYEALRQAEELYDQPTIVGITYSQLWHEEPQESLAILDDLDHTTVWEALINGYNVRQETPQDILHEAIDRLEDEANDDYIKGFVAGAQLALGLHGTQYPWLNSMLLDKR